ncbi:MAG: hypothetical protein ACFFB5_13105 [Promethearchaeota archaeon]
MSSSHHKNLPKGTIKKYNDLEKKYGKEPKISAEELEKMRWYWH